MPLIAKTHHGRFHSDEVLAIEELRLKHPSLVVLRGPRTKEFFSGADFLVDIGREYRPKEGKFDHHQKDALLREQDVPYSSFGLVFNYIRQDSYIKGLIDEQFVRFIDRNESSRADEDRDRFGLHFSQILSSLNPNWLEEEQRGFKAYDTQFVQAQAFAREAMRRLEAHAGAGWRYAGNTMIATYCFKQALEQLSGVENGRGAFIADWQQVCEEKGFSDFVSERFNKRVARHIDGAQASVPNKYGVQEFFSLYAPLPREMPGETLQQGVERAKLVIDRELTDIVLLEQATAELAVSISPQDQYLLLPKRRPYYEVIKRFPQIEYVLAQEDDQGWVVISPSVEGKRKNLFPKSWRGREELELRRLTAVESVLFCHRDGFIAKTATLKDAYRLADASLQALKG